MPRNKVLNEQMREESRKKILATAGRLFAQQGFFNVRIADVARAAEMSPGNIYWYFNTKEDILKAILSNVFEGLEQQLIESERWPGSGIEKLVHLIDLQLAFMQIYGSHMQIYLSIIGHGGSEYFKELGFNTEQIGMGYHQHLSAILNQAIEEGSIPPCEPNILAMFFFSLFNGLLFTYGEDLRRAPGALIRQAALRVLGYCGELPTGSIWQGI